MMWQISKNCLLTKYTLAHYADICYNSTNYIGKSEYGAINVLAEGHLGAFPGLTADMIVLWRRPVFRGPKGQCGVSR